jgi:hypothetical protein
VPQLVISTRRPAIVGATVRVVATLHPAVARPEAGWAGWIAQTVYGELPDGSTVYVY